MVNLWLQVKADVSVYNQAFVSVRLSNIFKKECKQCLVPDVCLMIVPDCSCPDVIQFYLTYIPLPKRRKDKKAVDAQWSCTD